MAGRPAKPTQLKMLQGTYRPDRATRGEVCPEPARNIAPPAWLSDPAQDKWNEVAPILSSGGLLTRAW
jgi:phage terminase small subunit